MRLPLALATLAACGALAAPLHAQCPDGTPPPCAGARVRAAAHAPPNAAERGRRFLILPFRNLSRSPDLEWLVEGSTTMLADALSRWQEITVVPDERLYPALRRAGLQSGAVMDPVRVRRVAEETAGWTAVTGEVLATGGRVRVSARAYDVLTGRELVRASDDVAAGADVRPAFERIGTRLLRTAGLDTASVDLGAATTRSLDAYRAYLRGVAFSQRAQYRRAREALLEAVRLDSTFAKPYVLLSISSLFINPLSTFDPQSAAHRYAARAAQLSAQLPAADRDHTLALNAIFEGQFTAARRTLERLVAADSNDINAVSLLSLVEYSDPLLVPSGRGERPRGSLNRNNRLARRVLELDPLDHAAFIPLVYAHLLAGGGMPGLIAAVHREAGSFQATFLQAGNVRLFVPLLRDSFELVPVESLSTVPAETLAVARRRALLAARDIIDRWLAVGQGEAEAHVASAAVSELLGEWERALGEIAVAESLGVEVGLTCVECRRLALTGKLHRYEEAQRIAADLWARGLIGLLVPVPTDNTEAFAWMFNLFLMRGGFARADSALARMTTSLLQLGMLPDSTFAGAMAVTLVAGSPARPIWQLELPLAFRADVMDSVWARRAQVPAQGRVGRALPTLQRLASAAVTSDSALAARVRAAPWYLR